MSIKPVPEEHCSAHLGLYVRPTERERVRAEARRLEMTTAAFIRSKFEGLLEPVTIGRPWPGDGKR
jgi:hypothetical protein